MAITVFFLVFLHTYLKNCFLPFWNVANIKERYISLCIPLKKCEKIKFAKICKNLKFLVFSHFFKVWIKKNTIYCINFTFYLNFDDFHNLFTFFSKESTLSTLFTGRWVNRFYTNRKYSICCCGRSFHDTPISSGHNGYSYLSSFALFQTYCGTRRSWVEGMQLHN